MTVSGTNLHSNLYYDQPNRIFGGYFRAVYRACTHFRGRCFDLKCRNPECRKRHRWSVWKRIDMGTSVALERGDLLRFATFAPLDTTQETYELEVINTLKGSIFKVQEKLMERLRRKGHVPMWWRVWGLKQNSYPHQLHLHLLFTCTSDCDPFTDPALLDWLEQVAAQHGLRVHIKPVTDVQNIARYMAYKNLSELDEIDLPPRFQRFRASNNAPKMDWQIRKALRRKCKALLKRLAKAFPILSLEHSCKLLVKHLRYLLAQSLRHGTSQSVRPSDVSPVPSGRWFRLRMANLWRKVCHEISRLSHFRTRGAGG